MAEPVHLRPPLRQFLTLPALAIALFALTALLPPHRAQWLLFPLTAVLMIAPARGLLLTDDHLVFWRLFGRRRIAWSDVTEIGVRTGALTVTANHINERLSALRPGWVIKDPEFDRKLEVVRRWWAERRSPA
ncbi:MAG: hypothetical protein DLM59_02880 [Pseudonocardiales bacterium]|nr:MAG: hypothetical protein DLM59_02880 [Pseudonocardiales bacterium]